jgi:Asp-tRNA(Asn)/Glu-tRNA(Gln) amidotransferase B subunit
MHLGRARDAGAESTAAANVIANQLVGAGVDPDRVNPAELAKLVAAREEIPRKTFDEAIAHAGDSGFSADPYLEQKAVAETSELEPIVDEVLAANAANVEAYRAGKSGLLGFFVGQVMKATNGQADARAVNDLVRKKLEE